MSERSGNENYEALYAEEAAMARAQGLITWVMDQRGITQKVLAEKLNVSEAAISKMLANTPENLTVKRLARVLNALDDKLNLSSELRDFAFPDQPACGVLSQPAQVWLECEQSKALAMEHHGGKMIFEDILHFDGDTIDQFRQVSSEIKPPPNNWPVSIFSRVANSSSAKRNRLMEDA